MHTATLNHITKADKPFQSFSSDPNTVAATAIIHGDVHGSGESLLDRLGVIMSDDDRRHYAEISQHTYVEQYHYANLCYSAALSEAEKAESEDEKTYFTSIAQQKDNLFCILKKHIQDDLRVKKDIFARIDVADPEKLRLLLGDVTGDRGCSELDILLLLVALIKKGINIKILLGNHDLETLVTVLTKNWAIDAESFAMGDQVSMRSLINLKILLHYGFVTHEELAPLIEVWKNLLEPLYYFWKPIEDAITCTHAPVGLKTFEALANTCGTSYDDMTDNALYQSLDNIRKAFKESRDKPASDSSSFLSQIFREKEEKALGLNKIYPWHELTWRRETDGNICMHKEGQTYKRRHINGHDTPKDAQKSPTESLNNNWQKAIAYRLRYNLSLDCIEETESANILTSAQPNKLYYYTLTDTLVGYCGILEKGYYDIREKTCKSDALPPHYFSGVIQINTRDNIPELLLQEIWSNIITAALSILPDGYTHKSELTYVVTDYQLADTPRPQVSPKKRALTESVPLSPLSSEQLSSHGSKRSKIDDNSPTIRNLSDVFDVENVATFSNNEQSTSCFGGSSFSLFTAVTGKPSRLGGQQAVAYNVGIRCGS